MKNRLIQIVVLISSIFLIGCHKLGATTRIDSAGSGELRTEVGFSADERENLEKENNNSEDFCNTSETPPNIIVTEEQRGDETWCITTTPFDSLDELRGLYQQRIGLIINQLEIADGVLYYDIDIDTQSEDSSFSALTEIRWSVILPDVPINHNADEVDGNTLTWMPVSKSGVVNLHAESKTPQDGSGFQICGIPFTGLGLVFVLLQRRRNSQI